MKRLGIVGTEFYTGDDTIFGTNSNYFRLMSEYGTPELLYPNTSLNYMLELDGIFLPGGPDVSSDRYREAPSFWTGKPSQFLEHFDKTYLQFLIGNVPIIGICRGLQTLNVVLGGTLHQHLKQHPYSFNNNDLAHEVITEDKRKIKVNSFHHQGIKDLAVPLKPVAYGPKNLIEAVVSVEMKIFAVQWHPERMDSDWFSDMYITKCLSGGL